MTARTDVKEVRQLVTDLTSAILQYDICFSSCTTEVYNDVKPQKVPAVVTISEADNMRAKLVEVLFWLADLKNKVG